MKTKKLWLGFLFVIGFFFLGTCKVDAATYKYCEYTLPKGTAVKYQGGFLWLTEKTKALEKDSILKFVFKDNSLVAASAGEEGAVNLLVWKNYGAASSSHTLDDLGIDDFLEQSDCPDTLTTEGVFIEENYESFKVDYNGTYDYKKTSNSKTYSNLPSLECIYKKQNLGNREEIPSYIDSDNKLQYNQIQVVLSIDDIISPKVGVIGDYTEGKSPGEKKLLDVLNAPKEFTNDWYTTGQTGYEFGAPDYKYLLDALISQTCPSWFVYNPADGYYLSQQEISTKGAPNLYGVDNDYTLYMVDNTKFCNEQIDSYEKVLDEAEKELDNIAKELDAHIKNKTFTQELKDSYMDRIKKLEDVETTLSDDNINQYFGSEGEEVGICADGYVDKIDNINTRKASIKEQLTTTILGDKISQANQASTVLTAEEKVENEREFLDLQNYFQDLLTSISLDNFDQEQSCDTIFGDFDDPNTLGGMIQTIFNMIKIVAPILVIVLGAFDFGKAVIASDQDALKKAQSSFMKRLIAAIALFFLPTLINMLLKMINAGIDPTCGIK